ncbi:uncharacterized protein [Phaseolus vulgaris]|uniref:uncharacterized protein n=1 Tax=Phaseolus vulgaris TaxID=3885 RepID=UPI0035CB4C8C
MIIPGKQMTGNNIDVYLQPLIKELKELWFDGVQTFDYSKKEMFTLRAALLWTISDFPGLGNLSGWNTHTGLAFPTCNFDTESSLLYRGKYSFMGHRRFLHKEHRFRLSRSLFDERTELREAPEHLSGSDIFKQVGKPLEPTDTSKRGRGKNVLEVVGAEQWKKRSIFFDLPYWETNLLHHCLDVMHIEKNVCDNVLYTLLNDPKKSKDNLKARKVLKEMGIRNELWPDERGRFRPSVFSLSKPKKKTFLQTLKDVKMPDGYSSNISRCIDLKAGKIFGLKSHDCHILMEHLLPIALRNVLPNNVTAVIVELCSFFRQLCGKSLSQTELDKLQSRIIETLCHMEMLFPPTFFTVMVHLTCHLVGEAKLGGPVHYRWMYPIERYLGHLKSYVRNKAQPEGSIAEGYLAEEVLTFTSEYMEGVETRSNRPSRMDDSCNTNMPQLSTIFPPIGRVINNPDISSTVSNDLKYLSQGPTPHARRFSAFNVNGFKFRTESREHGLKTQNSGVYLTSSTSCVASMADQNIREADLAYYGKLEDIIELNYYGRFKVTLFKCKWADTTRDRGLRKDPWGFTSINFSRLIHMGDREEHDPYIEASQAEMVYYVNDEVNKDWKIVVHLKPRDLYDMGEGDNEVCELEPCPQQDLNHFFSESEHLPLFRDDEDDELLNEDNNDHGLHENDSMSE